MSDALINGLAGAGGGIIAQLITYPLQTVNTRQQTERDLKKAKRQLGTIDHMYQVVKHEGWGRLYGGLPPSIVGTAASQGVYYYFYQIFRNRAEVMALKSKKKGLGDGSVGMLSSLVVAALAGCVNVLLTNPIWVVVTRMQTHKKTLNSQSANSLSSTSDDRRIISEKSSYGTRHTIQDIYGEAGIRGFWKGVIPTLIMVCNPALQFTLYETLLKKLKKRIDSSTKGSRGVTALEVFLLGALAKLGATVVTYPLLVVKMIFLLGALAKLGATVVTYPLLVVKSRLQAKQITTGDKRLQYKGTLDAILKMIRYEGFFGFYKGMRTKIFQSVLAASVLFMIKEELVKGARLALSK